MKILVKGWERLAAKVLVFGLSGLCAVGTIDAQEKPMSGAQMCSLKRIKHFAPLMKTESENSPRHSFDVLNYTLSLDIYNCFFAPFPKSYEATNVITFKADSTISSIQLNAVSSSLAIDSVALAGKSFFQKASYLTIGLDAAYSPNDTVRVKIYYHHQDIADGSFYANNGMVFTDCEPEGARRWFPCWDRPSDKATLDLTARVPADAKLGSNGRLADTLRVGDALYYHWISRDPIATYLMVMSAKRGYNLDIVYWKKLSNPNDSIPMVFYSNSGESPKYIETIILPMTNRYSTLFGEHPFEKNGFASLNNQFPWGGMENQTLTSICPNCWNENLISHEFAHQWFGDMISPGTWADVWLNEGFATYCEAIWDEYGGGYTAYKSAILGDATEYLSFNPGWPIYNPQWAVTTPDVNTMFNTAITYDKGACVLHMLRYVLGDSVFFAALKGYATDSVNFKLKNAVTDDFIQKMNNLTGQNLTWFFNEWLKQANHPVYQNYYSIDTAAKKVSFNIVQTQKNPPLFTMPVDLKFSFSDKSDTTIRVLNNDINQEFDFTFTKVLVDVQFDPDNDIVLKQATTIKVTGAPLNNVTELRYSLDQNYPNPFNPATRLSFTIADKRFVSLKIYDELGKEVADLISTTMNPGSYSVRWDAQGLPSGVYFYQLRAGQFVQARKLVLLK